MAKQNTKESEEIQQNISDFPKVDECFIITPIGDYNSETWVKANGLIDAVIQPVLNEVNYKAIAAHQISKLGSINNQIIKHILEDKLVIANLTDLNPNVMYELAIRHAARLPVIIMAEKLITPRLPFDITDQRTIFYENSLAGAELAKDDLRKMVNEALVDSKPDNPIYSAASQDSIFKPLDDADPLKIIMSRLDSIEQTFASSQKNAEKRVNYGLFPNRYERQIEEEYSQNGVMVLDIKSAKDFQHMNELTKDLKDSLNQMVGFKCTINKSPTTILITFHAIGLHVVENVKKLLSKIHEVKDVHVLLNDKTV